MSILNGLNPSFVEPHLIDLLNLVRKQIALEINCHHVGTVQAFDAVAQNAKVTINYPKVFKKLNPSTGAYVSITQTYPILIDAPVISLGGGTASLTFPIKKGDECLVLFNDRSLDNWITGGPGAPPSDQRTHSYSDGIILVGLRSNANLISNYDSTRAVLQNGTTMIGIGTSLIKIANNGTTLNTLLQSLVTDIKNLISAVSAITVTGVSSGSGTSGPPANVAAINAVATQLTTLGTQIGQLLE